MGSVVSLPPPVAIYQASRAGRVDDVRTVIHEAYEGFPEGGCLEWEDEVGHTALSIAARSGHTACVELLLDLGADCRHSNRRPGGGTALHEAVESKSLSTSVISSLLLKGANPFVENDYCVTPWEMALARGESSLCRKFEKEKGLFAHRIQVGLYGDAALDRRRWVCVLPRFGSSYHTSDDDCLSMTLYVFHSMKRTVPQIKVDVSMLKNPVVVKTRTGAIVFLGPMATCTSSSISPSSNLVLVFGSDRNSKKQLDQFLKIIERGQRKHVDTASEKTDAASFNSRVPHQGEPVQRSDRTLSSHLVSDSRSSLSAARRHVHSAEISRDRVAPFGRSASAPCTSVNKRKRKGNEIRSARIQLSHALPNSSGDGHGDKARCVVCLEKPPTAGFVHGTSIHRCVCKACAMFFHQPNKAKCPICRQEIQHIITDFF